MKIRSILLGLAILFLFYGHQSKEVSASNREALKERLEKEIQASGAEVGIAFKDLESSENLFINAKEMMHAASLMKVPVMIEVFKQAEQGKFDLDDPRRVKNTFSSIADGSPFSLNVADDSDKETYNIIGQELPIREMVHRMITRSSNLTTNILVELVWAKSVMMTLKELGIHRMQVLRGVEDQKAYSQDLNNTTDAYDMMLVMEAIATGKAGSEEACQEMVEILSHQEFRAKIPSGIPEDVKVANKTGSITRIDHDAAIVFPPGRKPYVLVVLTRGISDQRQAEELIAKLSKCVYEYVVSLGQNLL